MTTYTPDSDPVIELANRIKKLARELGQIDSTEGNVAFACLMTVAGAILEGGEPMMAFADMCQQFSLNAIGRAERRVIP